jgi:hypothetical protein
MDKYKHIISEAINTLNWDMIMKAYVDLKLHYTCDFRFASKETLTKASKKKTLNYTVVPSMNNMREELENVVRYVINNNYQEMRYGYWYIFWVDDDLSKEYGDGLGCELEILFCPTSSVSFENEDAYKCNLMEPEDLDYMEEDMLQDILDKAVSDENFELAAVILKRINKLKKPKIKAKKKNE